MKIARLQAGIKWTCSECTNVIPNGEEILINKKPYCEFCGEKILKIFKKKAEELRIQKIKNDRNEMFGGLTNEQNNG